MSASPQSSIGQRFTAGKTRFGAFMLDWASWGYVSYAVMYLLQRYWYRYIDFYGELTLPLWGWPVVILATLELAVISHAFGHSLGLSLFGLRLFGPGFTRPSLKARFSRLLKWHLYAPLQLYAIISNRPRGYLLHDSESGTRMLRVAEFKGEIPTERPRKWYLTHYGLMSVLLLGLTFWLGWLITGIELDRFVSRAGKAAHIWRALVTPSFEHLFVADPQLGTAIIDGALESVFMALLATVIGGIIAFPVSFLGARNIMSFNRLGLLVYTLTRGYFNIVRSVPSLVWASIFVFWVGFGPFAGSLALMLHTTAALGKLFSEQVEAIDHGPLEALAAAGARRWQVVIYGVIPQIVPSYFAFSLYRWDINVRMATVIAWVGGGGIGRNLRYYMGEVGRIDNAWNQAAAVVWVIVVFVWLLDYVSGRTREKIV